MYADIHTASFRTVPCFSRFNRIQNFAEITAQKHGNNCGRRFVAAKAVIVSGTGDGNAEQILMFVNCTDNRA